MNRRLMTALLVSSVAVATPASAQDGESTDSESEPAEKEAKADKGESASEKSGDEASGDEASGDEDAADDSAQSATDEAPPAEGEEKLGPGGKPLRTDYPGTEESLKSRMETDAIEGLQVDPNQPQAAYGMRIKELETKIDDLKEKVFQSKTRIVLLRETLLSGNLAGARAIIVHKTELGSAWRLQQAYYALDGTKLTNRTSEEGGELSEKRVFQVYDGSVAPGAHNLSVLVNYRGTNVGVFPYFKGYDGDIKSSCEFKAQEGKIAQVKVRVVPVGGAAESIEKRPNIKCEVEYLENLREASDAPAAEDGGDAAEESGGEAESE